MRTSVFFIIMAMIFIVFTLSLMSIGIYQQGELKDAHPNLETPEQIVEWLEDCSDTLLDCETILIKELTHDKQK